MTASESAADDREIRCPRCGYDQRGVVNTWRDSCPLRGVCSECGFEFAWDEVLRPERLTPKWCVEFTPRARGIPLASLQTFIRSCWPWAFWGRMKMAFTIQWGRLAGYLLMLMLPLLLGYVLVQSAAAVVVLWSYRQNLASTQRQLPAAIQLWQTRPMPSSISGPALPSMRIADRLWGEQMRKVIIARLTQLQQTPMTISHTYAAAIFEAVFFPLSEHTSGTMTYPNFSPQGKFLGQLTVPYPVAPAQLYVALSNPPVSATTGGYGHNLWREAGPALGAVGMWCMSLIAPLPLSLALLPITRRRAKVRWAHIARVFAYSVSIPIVFSELIFAVWIIVTIGRPVARFDEDTLVLTTAITMPLITLCWWWAGIKHYLRLPHALAVTFVMACVCMLMFGAAAFYVTQALAG